MNKRHNIVLASGSPRRRELLTQLPVDFKVAAADIDESLIEGESPRDYVLRLSRAKAVGGFRQNGSSLPVLGSDTIVLLDGEILGKPVSRSDAESMLNRLSDRTHQVYSAVALVVDAETVLDALNITAVTFAAMPAAWIRQYCQSDEPMDKAGAYAVQGGTGQYISRIEGSYSGVMGLPLFETAELLRRAGLLS
ncbi:MAG: Maf family protein [Lysobacterales bacterium]